MNVEDKKTAFLKNRENNNLLQSLLNPISSPHLSYSKKSESFNFLLLCSNSSLPRLIDTLANFKSISSNPEALLFWNSSAIEKKACLLPVNMAVSGQSVCVQV